MRARRARKGVAVIGALGAILGAGCLGEEPRAALPSAAGGGGQGGTGGAGGGGGAACAPPKVAACMRGAEGVWCAPADGTDFRPLALATDAFLEADWNEDRSVHLTLRATDVTGDGADDLCWREPSGIWCAVADGEGGFQSRGESRRWLPFFTDAQQTHLDPSEWATIQFGDIDGDGAADVCGRRTEGIACARSDPTNERFGAVTTWASMFTDADNFGGLAGYWGTILMADIDGDGDADICGRGVHGVECGRSDGAASFIDAFEPSWYPDFAGWGWPAFWGTIQFPDLDGDGAADLCARNKGGLLCRLWRVDRFDLAAANVWSQFTNEDGWTEPYRWGSITYPDVDGDGRADVCARGPSGIECGLSDGTRFAARTVWQGALTDEAGWTATERWRTIRYPDLDGDGDADLCVRDGAGLKCALSTGETFGELVSSGLFDDAGGWGETHRNASLLFVQTRADPCPGPGSYAIPWVSHALPPRYP